MLASQWAAAHEELQVKNSVSPSVREEKGSIVSNLIRLVLDPSFHCFEALSDQPSLFRIVGYADRETWHSRFLGWLLDPNGSHRLGSFALRRLLAAAAESDIGNDEIRDDVRMLSAVGDFSKCTVAPSERVPGEKSIDGGEGKLDVFVDNISFSLASSGLSGMGSASGLRCDGFAASPIRRAVVVIEQKVRAKVDPLQCKRYLNWLEKTYPNDLKIPVYLSPYDLMDDDVFRDEQGHWFGINYQVLHDEVLEPSLRHPELDNRVRQLLEHYVVALRLPTKGFKMAYTEDERRFAREIYEKHKDALEALINVLADVTDSDGAKNYKKEKSEGRVSLVLDIGSRLVSGESVREFLAKVIKVIDESSMLEKLIDSVYLSNEPTGRNGKRFVNPGEYKSHGGQVYYFEANVGRSAAIRRAQIFLEKVGLEYRDSGVSDD